MKPRRVLFVGLFTMAALLFPSWTFAQSELYPNHFDLKDVTLLDGPFKTALEKNNELLLQYDVDRLLTPFIRQAGLSSKAGSPYQGWTSKHPKFVNWGDDSFNLEGHVGGHYLSALALAYAATPDASIKKAMKDRLDYMINILKDCQDAYDNNKEGLYGFIGGQPINDMWKSLYTGSLSVFSNRGGWVPFYCQHKVLAGLRDAYLYGENETAKELFRKLADWSVNVVSKLSDSDMESMLNWEHGGMNESLLDAYQLFGDRKYLTAAKRFSHKTMLNGMQSLNTTFLDGKHANTQVPKYIGFERIYENDATATNYRNAANNFWNDVANNRTVCIGGNSVNEHFLSKSNGNRYIDQLDGPESCNSNNMLKLSEMMNDRTHDAKYADFYENTMWNHILSTQDPLTGGYVYFTTLRPQGYRIYSRVNQGMWCCVGTGMENHSKYGHFIYTHDGNNTLYVNLFIPSELNDKTFGVRQETKFPFIETHSSDLPTPCSATTNIVFTKAGDYTLAVRHPAWAGEEYKITVNGEDVAVNVTKGKASYATINRSWKVGDVVRVYLPMELKYEECPNYTDYIAFKFGPILLGAQTTATSSNEASITGLPFEQLQNVYGGEGRMDHAPGSRASSMSLTKAPLLIGNRANVLDRIQVKDLSQLKFTIDASRPDVASYTWNQLELRPFYDIHHARYMCYWYQQTAENYANSDMAASEAANEALLKRTLDFVAPGEQQSEAGHEYSYSSTSSTGNYNSERYRDAQRNGYIQYTLYNNEGIKEKLSILCRFTTADKGRMATLYVDGTAIADITIPSSYAGAESNGFYNIEYPIPDKLIVDKNGNAKKQFVVKLQASSSTFCPGLYFLRLMKEYDDHAYRFVANDWVTGDAARVSANNITYDTEKNIIHVRQTGDNNICLSLNYQNKQYTVSNKQKYFVVKGTNLKTTSGASYLWWLNGVNKWSQVSPNLVKTVTENGQNYQVIAWDITKSGLDDNFTGERTNVCSGATIFGLTSSSSNGSSDICLIDFVEDVQQDVINAINLPSVNNKIEYYNPMGLLVNHPTHGIYISQGKKILMK